MALIDKIQQKSFLGTEFATWLWYRAETNANAVALADGSRCEIAFEKDIVLTSESGQARATALKGENPTMSLGAGKKVKRARIGVTYQDTTLELTLNAETLDWGGLRLNVPNGLPMDEGIPVRLRALDAFSELFDRLFETFLDIRLDPKGWDEELGLIREWVANKMQTTENGEG
jgi:hypothetical protein